MTVVELISRLGAAGIKLWLEDDQLKFKAPKGALTPELKDALVAAKTQVIDFLKQTRRGTGSEDKIPVTDRSGALPLSFAQQRLWFVEQLAPGNSTFHIPSALYLKGILDRDALRQAFEAILERHEALRTVYETVEDEPKQRVLAASPLLIPFVDLTSLSSEEQRREAKRLAELAIRTPFNLSSGPLIRAQLFKLDDHLHGLVVVMHHIASDGWSMDVFVKEMALLYASFRQGNPSPLPPLDIQYGDFSVWQREWLKGENLDKQLNYWRNTLANCPEELMLPFDRPRPALQTANGAALPLTISKDVAERIRTLARQLDVTPYILLFSVYQLLLARWSGQEDLCVGMPVAGRTKGELEALIGFFVNTLVIRGRLEQNPSFEAFVGQIREQVLQAQAHQDLPFEAIVDSLNVPRNLAFSPLVQVAFSFVSSKETSPGVIGGLEIEPMPVDLIASRLDMTLMLLDKGNDISGIIEYNTDLFDQATMEAFAEQYAYLLAQLDQQLKTPVHALALWPEEDLPRMLGVNLRPHESEFEAVLPLTPMQRDFCLDSLREPARIRNSIGYASILPVAVDVAKWRAALQAVSDNQPALRTVLLAGTHPWMEPLYQGVKRQHAVDLSFEDLSGDAEFRQIWSDSVQRKSWIDANTLRAWDISQGVLVKYRLIKVADSEFLAICSAHHAMFDGISKLAHLRQVLASYSDEVPQAYEISAYRDHIYQRRSVTDTPKVLKHWRDHLSNVESIGVRLPAPGQLARQQWQIDGDSWLGLTRWCQEKQISSANYLRTLYALAVQSSHYEAGDIALIDALSGRNQTQYTDVGCYFQFTPVVLPALNQCADWSLESLLQKMREDRKALGDTMHVSMFARHDLLSRDALEFQFNYRLPDIAKPMQWQGSEVVLLPIQPTVSGVVKLIVTQHEAGTLLELSYWDKEFSGLQLLERMQQVHAQIQAADSLTGVRVRDIDWLLPQEKTQLSAWQGPVKSLSARNVVELIQRQVVSAPGNIAVIRGNDSLTYAQLDALSNQVAHWLVNVAGVRKGERVGVCFGRSLMLPTAVLGAVKAGAVYVPMDANYPAERLQFLLQDSAAVAMISETCVIDRVTEQGITLPEGCQVLRLDNAESVAQQSTSTVAVDITPEDRLYMVYTSGSTGLPKGAGVRHSGEVNLLNWYIDALKLTEKDRGLLLSAFGFDLTQKNLFALFASGGALVIPEQEHYDPDYLAAALHRFDISLINGAPSAFYPLVDNEEREGYPYPKLRNAVLGGEPIRLQSLSRWLEKSGAGLMNSYGPTECTDVVAAWFFRSGTEDDAAFPIGAALPNTSLYVTDILGRRLPIGATGELRVAGIGVGTGYHQRDELTQQVFQPCPYQDGQWYSTGDLVYYREDGALIYRGRKDFQVKLRGLRIEPGEVDTLLKGEAGVQDALTLVRDEQLISYVITGGTINREALRDALKGRLPEFMVPSAIVPLAAWPLTPNGKIDRKALPSPAAFTLGEGEYIAPRNSSEEQVAAIWQQVLRRERVSVTANFFDLGGHSLLATQVVSRLRHLFRVDISVRALFEAPTVEKLVRYISTASSAGLVDDAPPMQALATPNRDTLSFAQYRLWFIDQLNQGSSEYNLPSAFRIDGPLDLAVLDRVFTEIVRRHETLRTNFMVEDGMPQLNVAAPFDWKSPVEDLSLLPESDQQKKVAHWVDIDANKTFQLASDSLFSTRILKLSPTAHVLLLNMHHIIADGWSISVLIREVQMLYQAFSRGQGSPLPELALQYSDFAVWQRNWLTGEVMEKLRAYWLNALRGAPDVLRLPTDKPRPKRQTFNGAHFPVSLSPALSAQVNAFCDKQGLTPFMVLMGAYQILLSRYANQKDISVGTPIAGRTRTEIEGLIGFFINGLVIRTKLDGNPSVSNYLQQMKEVALGAYAHQDMPIDVLADALQFERSSEHAPGAQVGFALQNTPEESLQADSAGLSIAAVPREHKTAKYELTLILENNAGSYSGVAEYNTDLFVASTIEQMMARFVRIVEQMITAPDTLLENISLVQADELYSLLDVNPQQYEVRPLSPMQRDMYLDTLLDPSTLKNSLGVRITTTGPFHLDHWINAAQFQVDNTPLLRAVIIPADKPCLDVAYLRIAQQAKARVTVVDWTDRVTTDEEAEQLGQKLAWQPYDIHGETQSEFFVYRLNDNRNFLLFRANHILLDGVGMLLQFGHQIQVAEALSRGETPPVIPDHFKDFVHQSREETDSDVTLDYWKKAATNLEAVDFSLPPQSKTAAATPTRIVKRVRLDDAHWQQVRAYCKSIGIHPSYYFKGLYGLMISVYCRAEQDFYISEVLGGRNGIHRKTYGNYFQVMPVVFPQSLFAQSEQVTALFDHVASYRKQLRNVGYSSLMMQRQLLPQGRLNFMFNYYNFIASMSLWGTPVETFTYPQVQDGPIQFVVHDQDGWLDLVLIYLTSQFDDLRFGERMSHVSQQIMNGVTALDKLSFVLPDEQHALIAQEQGPSVSFADDVTVVDKIQAQVRRTPDAIAIKQGTHTLTYAQLDLRSNQLARYLAQAGVGRGQRVGICLDRSLDLFVAVLGVLKAGAAYVPMDSHYPSERLSYILEDSQAPFLLTQECVYKRLNEEGIHLGQKQVLLLDTQRDAWAAMSDANLDTRPTLDDLIYVIYTSGSTGLPKGAAVYHRGEINLLHWYVNALSLSDADRFLLVSAIGFDLTQKNLFAPLTVGGRVVVPDMEQYDVDVVANTLHQEGITVVNCAPSAFYPVAEKTSHAGYPFPSLRFAVLGGEPIRYNGLQAWLGHPQCQCQLVNSYGPTECSDVVAAYTLANELSPPWEVIPLGRPVANTHLQVLSERGAVLPAGLVGELYIAGQGVGAGYLNRDELNAQSFVKRAEGEGLWYRTGDLVRRWPTGELEYIGRRDFQIKLRGLRIELGEIETALRQQAGVIDSLTLVVDDRLVAYIVADGQFDERHCRQALRAHLPEYMIPAVLVPLQGWPLTPNGKVDRKALPAPDAHAKAEFIAPRNDTEERIAAIWRDVLGVEKIGVYDDFFDLGGHSLLAARAVSKFRAEFQVEIPLRALFEMHTVADIAAYLDTLLWAANSAEVAASTSDENRDEGFL